MRSRNDRPCRRQSLDAFWPAIGNRSAFAAPQALKLDPPALEILNNNVTGMRRSKRREGCSYHHCFARDLRVDFRADFSMRKSSSFLPSFNAAASHRGWAPRPAQVSPPGPRYFAGTLRPFIALVRRDEPARKPPTPRGPRLASAPRRESCFSRSRRFSVRRLSISPRSASNPSTSRPLMLIPAISASTKSWNDTILYIR